MKSYALPRERFLEPVMLQKVSAHISAVQSVAICALTWCNITGSIVTREIRLGNRELCRRLAACRREHPSPWHARSDGRHSSTLVRFCSNTIRCSDRQYVRFGTAHHQRHVQIPAAYLIADETGTLNPGARYATASD